MYFSCSEALQNACKHARGATGVTISVWEDTDLHFEVRDDGAGFDLQTVPYGTGLTNLTDRLAALGGTVKFGQPPVTARCWRARSRSPEATLARVPSSSPGWRWSRRAGA